MSRLPVLPKGIGQERLVETLRREAPAVQLGNFTRPLA